MISLSIIKKRFKKTVILEDLSINLPAFGLYILKGRNGSGKTTLLNILAGLDLKYDGKLVFQDEKIGRKNCDDYYHNNVKLVFQSPVFFEELTVMENLRMAGMEDEVIRQELMGFDLESLLDSKVKDISTGEKARVALLRATLFHPDIILLDETTASLDLTNAQIYMNYIKTVSKRCLVIFSTHERLADVGLDEFEVIDLDEEKRIYDFDVAEGAHPPISSSKRRVGGSELFGLFKQNGSFLLIFAIIFLTGSFLFSYGFDQVSQMGDSLHDSLVNFYLANYEAVPLIDPLSQTDFDEEDIFYIDHFTFETEEDCVTFTAALSLTDLDPKFDLVDGSYPSLEGEVLISQDVKERYFKGRKIPFKMDEETIACGVFDNGFNSSIHSPDSIWSTAYDFSHELIVKRYRQDDFYSGTILRITNENEAAIESALRSDTTLDYIADEEGNNILLEVTKKRELYIDLYVSGLVVIALDLLFAGYLLYRKNTTFLRLKRLLTLTRKRLSVNVLTFSGLLAFMVTMISFGINILSLSIHYNSINDSIGGVMALFSPGGSIYLIHLAVLGLIFIMGALGLAPALRRDLTTFVKEEKDL